MSHQSHDRSSGFSKKASAQEKSIFTLAEVNNMLPLVKLILKNIVDDFSLLMNERRIYDHQVRKAGESAETDKIKERITDLCTSVNEYQEELQNLGGDLISYELGKVAFPTLDENIFGYYIFSLNDKCITCEHFTPLEDHSLSDVSFTQSR